MTLPWRGTTPEISSEADSRYETPGGAQNKVDISQEYLLHLLKLAVTGLSDGSEAAIARYSEPYNITYNWLKDRLDAADEREKDRRGSFVQGIEQLVYYNEKIRTKQPVKIIGSGDSTWEGVGITDPDFLMNNIIKKILNSAGVTSVTSINAGHSNMRTPQWQSTFLPADLAQNPDLYILRWGLNDGAHLPKSDRVRVFTDALRGGLTTLRAAKTVNQMSVILMMPNSTNDPANGRDAEWFDTIYPIIKKASVDFHCCFIDTYNYLQDSTNPTWEDGGDGGTHVHPLNIGNAWIASLMEDALIPASLRYYGVTNTISSDANKNSTDAPSTYPRSLSIYRTGTGFPYDGIVQTICSADGILTQINSTYKVMYREEIAIRRGMRNVGVPGSLGDDAWGAWLFIRNTESISSFTLQNGWTNYGAGYTDAGYYLDAAGIVHLTGTIKDGTMTAGTLIATLPVGYRPLHSSFRITAGGGDVKLLLGNDGTIRSSYIQFNDFVCLDDISFKAEQ